MSNDKLTVGRIAFSGTTSLEQARSIARYHMTRALQAPTPTLRLGSQGAPNPSELAALPASLDAVDAYIRETFPDVDPSSERRALIEHFVNVLRAAHAYQQERRP